MQYWVKRKSDERIKTKVCCSNFGILYAVLDGFQFWYCLLVLVFTWHQDLDSHPILNPYRSLLYWLSVPCSEYFVATGHVMGIMATH